MKPTVGARSSGKCLPAHPCPPADSPVHISQEPNLFSTFPHILQTTASVSCLHHWHGLPSTLPLSFNSLHHSKWDHVLWLAQNLWTSHHIYPKSLWPVTVPRHLVTCASWTKLPLASYSVHCTRFLTGLGACQTRLVAFAFAVPSVHSTPPSTSFNLTVSRLFSKPDSYTRPCFAFLPAGLSSVGVPLFLVSSPLLHHKLCEGRGLLYSLRCVHS
jgi:hypothetical protein